MMREEFERLIDENVGIDDYAIIDKVYTWHPAIKDKPHMVRLYTEFGMTVIRGMVEVADYMIEIDKERRRIMSMLEKLKERESYLKEGDTSFEKELEAVEKAFDESGTQEEFDKKCQKIKSKDIEYTKIFLGYSK